MGGAHARLVPPKREVRPYAAQMMNIVPSRFGGTSLVNFFVPFVVKIFNRKGRNTCTAKAGGFAKGAKCSLTTNH
ncbi:MAG: hypothetical protein LBS01_05385 [Prevotellaceae bacterium]|nr:hypothetical protein [Prevotellaceae bacterium]